MSAEAIVQVLQRVATILPEVLGLWDAVRTPDPGAQTMAQAKLVRAMRNAQMLEELDNGE